MQKGYGYDLRQRYTFINPPMHWPEKSAPGMRSPYSRVFLIRAVPLKRYKSQLWRYVMVGSPNGNASCASEKEELIQQMLAESGVTLTRPPGAPATESDKWERELRLPDSVWILAGLARIDHKAM